ncbi:hypothetical protein K7432_008519 [Basidiobolus ranarum]|uniref:Uncharacterized protein n=1 Tax=Basidiobolus ranarum TaxID=34480 RepID=A0ABR2WRN4_9FUNG
MRPLYSPFFTLCIFIYFPIISQARFLYNNVVYPSHDLYGNFQKNASVISPNFYNFTGIFVQARFQENHHCQLSNILPTITLSNSSTNQVTGTVLFISTEEILAHGCNGFSAVVDQLESFAPIVEQNKLPPLSVALFSSIGPQEEEFGGPQEPYGGRIPTLQNIHLAIVSRSVGNMLSHVTLGPDPYIALITQEPGPWNVEDTSYRLALHRWSLFVLTFFALIYAFYQLINLFYQEGWQFDTRIILYIAALVVLNSSLVSLAIRGQSKGIRILTSVAWLIGYSAYSAVQLKWGQIISKLFPNAVFKASYFFIIFVMINYVVITVLNISGVMVTLEQFEYARGIINAIYLPLLMSLQASLFMYYAMMYKRGMNAFPMTSRTRVSLHKLALLLIFAVLGFIFEAISQFLRNGSLVTSITGNILILTFNTLSQLALFSPVFAILSIRGTEDTATYAAILQRNRNGSSSSTHRHASTTHSNKTEPTNRSQALTHIHSLPHHNPQTHSFPINNPVSMNRYDLGLFNQAEDDYSSNRSVSISLDQLSSPRFSRLEDISTVITPLTPPPPRRREKPKSQASINELLNHDSSEKQNTSTEATTSTSGETVTTRNR